MQHRLLTIVTFIIFCSPTLVAQQVDIFELYQNYPNPFNPKTVIQYDVTKASRGTIEIFNLPGQKVRTLVNQEQPAGRYRVTWDARNDNGELVTAGLYICRMKTKEFVKSLSLVLVK